MTHTCAPCTFNHFIQGINFMRRLTRYSDATRNLQMDIGFDTPDLISLNEHGFLVGFSTKDMKQQVEQIEQTLVDIADQKLSVLGRRLLQAIHKIKGNLPEEFQCSAQRSLDILLLDLRMSEYPEASVPSCLKADWDRVQQEFDEMEANAGSDDPMVVNRHTH